LRCRRHTREPIRRAGRQVGGLTPPDSNHGNPGKPGPECRISRFSPALAGPGPQAALRPPPAEPVTEPVTLEAADEALLAVLVRDGRATLTELQAATGQTESVVKRRLERMRATGVLYFDVQFDQEPLGHDVEAMLWLTVAPAALADVGRALAAHPEVRFAAATTGQANIVAATVYRNSAELYTYLSEKIGALDGVRAVETALTLRLVKQLAYDPGR
jgi:DNA-binding Lrp family transcriptional regulator